MIAQRLRAGGDAQPLARLAAQLGGHLGEILERTA